MNELWAFLWGPYQSYTSTDIAVEILAAVFGVASVVLAQRRHIAVYPVGLVSTILYSYLFFKWGLYGETLINVYYTAMSLYGWVLWRRFSEQDHVHVQVAWASGQDLQRASVIWLLGLGLVLVVYAFKPWIQSGFAAFNSSTLGWHHLGWVEYVDAAVAATCFAAMWLQAQRRINHWLFWTIANMVMVPLMFYKGYGITALQYVLFLGLAVRGFQLWQKSLQASAFKC